MLPSTKNRCLARDHFLFPDNPLEILQKESTIDLRTWIASRLPAIKASIKRAKSQDVQYTYIIYKWFQPLIASVSMILPW